MLLISLLFVLLAFANSTWATDRYFKVSGSSDSNPCTESQPCTTMAKFATFNTPSAGDRYFFNCGDTFADSSANGIDWTSRVGTSGSPIIVTSYGTCTGSNRPIWDKTSGGYGIILKDVDWVQVSNIVIKDYQFGTELRGSRNITFNSVHFATPQNSCFAVKINAATSRTSRDIIVTNSELDTCGDGSQQGEGFYLGDNGSGGSGNFTLTNNYVHDTFFECVEVKEGTDPSITMRYNTFENCHRSDAGSDFSPGGNSGVGITAADGDGGDSDVTFEYNWIKDVKGSGTDEGDGIKFVQQGILARFNLIVDSQQGGITTTAGSGTQGNKEFFNNTIYSNTQQCISLGSGSSSTQSDNICWANGSGNDASDPLFVNAGGNNFNIPASSPAYQTAAGGISKGALQSFAWTDATLLQDGITVRVTGNVYSTFQPISTATANAFTLTCSVAGAQSGTTAMPSGTTDLLVTVATSIGSGETCTLSASAGAASDSANIGGALAPGGPRNSSSLALTDLSVTNNSTGGGGDPGTAPNLLLIAQLISDSGNFSANRGCDKLLDLDAVSELASAWAPNNTSFTCTWDLLAMKFLDNFIANCDDQGSSRTTHITVFTAEVLEGPYTPIIDDGVCNTRMQFEFDMGDVEARFVSVQADCDACAGTQVMELFLSETPQLLPQPGNRVAVHKGSLIRGSLSR